MTLRKMMTALFTAAAIIVLILDGQTVMTAASAGIELCLRTVIPSLFPFLFLCSVLTTTLWGTRFKSLSYLGKRLHIPNGAESFLIVSVLGGYPAGAQLIGESFLRKQISKEDAEHLLTFCSNAGPAFLFGMVALQFPEIHIIWILWIIQILSSFVTGMMSNNNTHPQSVISSKQVSISALLTTTVKNTGIICGWIILFRILIGFLSQWFLCPIPGELRVIFIGLMELSNGCCMLSQISSIPARFLICTVLLSFGGLCVTMQTASVIGSLPLQHYLIGKLIHTAVSFILALLYLYGGWIPLTAAGIFILFIPIPSKKEVDFGKKPLYNTLNTSGRK